MEFLIGGLLVILLFFAGQLLMRRSGSQKVRTPETESPETFTDPT